MPAISDIMTRDPRTAAAGDTLQSVASAMESGNFGSMPVLDGGRFVGVVTDRDIAVRAVAQGLPADTPVSEVMTAKPVCVAGDCDLAEAARLMKDGQIRRLYVTDGDSLVGVAALADVVAAAEERLSGETIEGISRN